MKNKNIIWIYPLIILVFVLIFTNSCKKKDDKSNEVLTIGQSYQGGKIFYILGSSDVGYDVNVQHGLIVAPSDQSTGAVWGCQGTYIAGAESTAIGTGNQNTIAIMAGCSTAGTAARLCGDLVLGGYSDWYLPSSDELSKMYDNKGVMGTFANSEYWSSSEDGGNGAWYLDFSGGGGTSYLWKDNTYHVRAIRSF